MIEHAHADHGSITPPWPAGAVPGLSPAACGGAIDGFETCAGDEVCVPRVALQRLCREALAAGVATVDAASCLARARHPHEELLGVAPSPSQSMAIHTLGRFALVRLGDAITFRGRSPHKPIELLQALVAFGGRGVHTELLMRAVWPDDDSIDLRNLFDNTLHRLRHLLDDDDVLTVSDARVTLDLRRCWVDTWSFERLAGLSMRAEASPLEGQRALHLYQGHFLALEAPRPWMHACRERLRSRFLRLVAGEAARLEREGRWRDAVACHAQGLEIDPLAEALYQQVMACHLRRGAMSDVLRTYIRCREMLARGLGVVPSKATEAIRCAAQACAPETPP